MCLQCSAFPPIIILCQGDGLTKLSGRRCLHSALARLSSPNTKRRTPDGAVVLQSLWQRCPPLSQWWRQAAIGLILWHVATSEAVRPVWASRVQHRTSVVPGAAEHGRRTPARRRSEPTTSRHGYIGPRRSRRCSKHAHATGVAVWPWATDDGASEMSAA